jgi:hypothetical protein
MKQFILDKNMGKGKRWLPVMKIFPQAVADD